MAKSIRDRIAIVKKRQQESKEKQDREKQEKERLDKETLDKEKEGEGKQESEINYLLLCNLSSRIEEGGNKEARGSGGRRT